MTTHIYKTFAAMSLLLIHIVPTQIALAQSEDEMTDAYDTGQSIYLNQRDCLTIKNPVGSNLELCGSWAFEPESQSFTASGTLDVETPRGSFELNDVQVTAHRDPLELSGSVHLPFPQLGFSRDVNHVGGDVDAELRLIHGQDRSSINVGGYNLNLSSRRHYLVFDYTSSTTVNFNQMDFITPERRGRLVIAPHKAKAYLGGEFAGSLMSHASGAALLTLSPHVPISHETDRALDDGYELTKRRVDGQAQLNGGLTFGAYPVHLEGKVVMNLDADQDGVTVFETSAQSADDVELVAEGSVSVGYQASGFDMDLEVGRGSLMYQGSSIGQRGLYFNTRTNLEALSDTPLSAFSSNHTVKAIGYWRDAQGDHPDFMINLSTTRGTALGFTLNQLNFNLTPEGVEVSSALEASAPLRSSAEIDLMGQLYADGDFELTGQADVHLAGFTLPQASLSLSNEGLFAQGVVDLGQLGRVDLSGHINTSGGASLSGETRLSVLGRRLTQAHVHLNKNHLRVTGELNLSPLGSVSVNGTVNPDGSYNLTGEARLGFEGINLHRAQVVATESVISFSGGVERRGQTIVVEGTVDANGFSFQGISDVSVSLQGKIQELQYIVDGVICGYNLVTGAAECGYEVVEDVAMCGARYVEDGARCGYQVVTSAARCGTETIVDGARCGFESFWSSVKCIFGCKKKKRPKSCNVPKSCRVPKGCNIANRCEIESTCEVELGCDTEVVIPNVNIGALNGQFIINADNSGLQARFSGEYCSPSNDCFELSLQLSQTDDTFRTCLEIPIAMEEVCITL
jgi:hypothetical protein